MQELLTENLRDLRLRIADACKRVSRDPNDITVIAVTKTHPTDTIRAAVAAGLNEIGESKIQEAEPKITELGPIARYHLIGHLQSNKVKKAVRLFEVIQSVDSLALAEEISRRAGEAGRTITCLIEINSSGEQQKFGVSPDRTLELIRQVNDLPAIVLAGLMTVGPLTEDEDAIRAAFRSVRQLFEQGRDLTGDRFSILSMGMTDDYPVAIEEGSTMIRIGTALFGARPPR